LDLLATAAFGALPYLANEARKPAREPVSAVPLEGDSRAAVA
jgi:hypothetical protein